MNVKSLSNFIAFILKKVIIIIITIKQKKNLKKLDVRE